MLNIASLPFFFFFPYWYDYRSVSGIIFCLEITHITLANITFAPFLFLAQILTEVPHSQTYSHSLSENSFWFLSPSSSRQTPISHSAVLANNCQRGAMSHFQGDIYAAMLKGLFFSFLILIFLILPCPKIIWHGLFLDCFKVYCSFVHVQKNSL